MHYRNLGTTGLKVSRLFFGGAHIGEVIDARKTEELVRAAWDAGINTFYTSNKYNNGAAEEILGKAVKPRREDCVLIMKTGYRVGTATVPVDDAERLATHGERGTIDHAEMWRRGVPPTSRGLSRKYIVREVEASLRRLQTDYIDVYEAHFWDYETPVEETLSAFDTLVRQGKVRYIGCSQTTAWQLVRALWVSDVKGYARYQTMQIRFNMIERANRKDQLQACAAMGVSILAFQSLAGGVLTGDRDRQTEISPTIGNRKMYTEMYTTAQNFDLVDRLRVVAQKSGRSVGELAQAWTLAQPAVTALQIGPNEAKEFEPQVRAATHPLAPDEAQAIDQILVDFP
jgi:aryl-alcohol dehydrogenase-like predicted oxidoreductase